MGLEATNSPVEESAGRYENLYAMLLDAIPSSVLLFDRNVRIVSVNRNFLEKNRCNLSDTIGHRLEDVFPAVLLDHMDIVRKVRKVLETNEPTEGERMAYRTPGIPMRIYYYRILPFSSGSSVENAMLLMDDVTEQIRLSKEVHRVERHLASVVESASDMVLSTGMDGRILSWNTAAQILSGYTLNDVKGHFFPEYCNPEHREEAKQVFQNMGKGKASQMVEWDLVTKGGEDIQVSWVLSTMKYDASQNMGIVAVGRDLTERRKIEMQLLQSQKLAALGVMAGGIAHEIRNPLAICSSAAQFLMDDHITPEFRRECAEKIYKGIQRAAAVIENLLKFSRPPGNRRQQSLDLIDLLKETMDLVANHAKVQKIQVRASFCNECVMISGVASLLQQLFMNLFLNAIKAMPHGGALSIAVRKTEREVLVQVSDTGHGISEADKDKLFDPFYTSSPVGQGTGLGLSICYSVVTEHFGSIEVDSPKGKGTTFTVRLPTVSFRG
ncbi:MAG: PAS domain S-box protein [Deltaproteobacteria bacterium]|nr:PAS domain S-box protein [Deltaproteobacteria bacterium]